MKNLDVIDALEINLEPEIKIKKIVGLFSKLAIAPLRYFNLKFEERKK